MELLRALGALAEPPDPALQPVADALELGALPPADVYTEVFVFQLVPFASVYLGAEGMLGGEARDRIAGFWRAVGAEPPTEPDHLTMLLTGWADLDERVEDARGEPHAEAAETTRDAFLNEHLWSWLPVYLDAVAALCEGFRDAAFYRRWADMLMSVLTERASAPRTSHPSLHLREAPALRDPRNEGADAFLADLLTPVRSGVVVTGHDLRRAARALGLGLRAGERRFVLRALIGQDAGATLDWLATFAHEAAADHQSSAWPVRVDFWAARAHHTASLLGTLARAPSDIDRKEPST